MSGTLLAMRTLRRGMLILAAVTVSAPVLFFLAPLPAFLRDESHQSTLRILDRNGQLLYEERKGAPGSQRPLTLKEIPDSAIRALIATEDRTFMSHRGVSARAIARATLQNLSTGGIVSGGSTITQQLVRARAGASARRGSYLWKVLEMLYAVKLDAALSKEQILEQYLNTVYFGHQAYGIEAAARTYVGKSAHELSVAESALLIGLIQSPGGYDPFSNFSSAKKRQGTVLAAMRDHGDITAEQLEDAAGDDLSLAADRVKILAPHFVFWVLRREDLARDVDEIRTTLDLGLQRQAEDAVARQLEKLENKNVTSAAVVVMDAENGDVLAMVGSGDYFDKEHDGAVNVALSARQPGSAIKPFTYALAMTKGDNAATTVADVETQFFTQEGNPYIPRNYDYGYHGLVRYREALANSYNIAAVKVLERVGIGNLLGFLRDAGITRLTESAEHYGLALTLGDAEVSLLELSRAFGIFPRGGKTLHERTVLSDPVEKGSSILDSSVAWLISDILSDDEARMPQFGLDGPLNFDFPVAVKTGTTRNSRDNWTIGYTPKRIVGVWVGNADNTPMKGTSGVTGAGPIFHDVMEAAMRGIPKEPFVKPKNIRSLHVCALSGQLPTPECSRIIAESFIAGSEPKEPDQIFQRVRIDSRNGLRAGDNCNAKYVRNHVFAVFPPDVRRWARENGWKEAPQEFSSLCGQATDSRPISGEQWITITRPSNGDEFQLDPMVPNSNEKIIFEANARSDVKQIEWRVNGAYIGVGTGPTFRITWPPTVGFSTVEASGSGIHDAIHITVTENGRE